ncbi:MAG TPA: MMPL family transporter [Aromatoleum sp.]|uniref:MMPL family transporter n=1 Tax=Aromatoleum sp. TaxID=2307007 RepID=UPI002B498634|nr:MMPL family transporter [Aromatoleum sp.]HJV27474.1 MMPL family transporter [Aromatoleum sp.]
MKRRPLAALLLWLGLVIASIAVIVQTRFTTDLSAFLPDAPTAEQRLLIDQLRDGMVSRLLLVGIEGGDPQTRATVSRTLGEALRDDPAFVSVANGEAVHRERDQKLLFENRYLLSPAVNPERFTEDGLHEAIAESIDLLASPVGMLTKSLLPRDPTGELMQLLERLDGGNRPATADGIWVSRDRSRALLLAQTRASGSDLDAQQAAIETLRATFLRAVVDAGKSPAEIRLLLTGPGVFAVASRSGIQDEVGRLAIVSTSLIVALLLFIYRSPTALVLGLLPVASGALAGIVAVSLGFGSVHGITLGFGTTLIGEAVDYAIYLFVQSDNKTSPQTDGSVAPPAFWPTIRLGVMTSICGFAALMFSGFPGLSQLGLYTIAGLIAAALSTRFILPHLLPPGFAIRDVTPFGERLAALVKAAHPLRRALIVVALIAAGIVWVQRDTVWNRELSALSPVPDADQALDMQLRSDLGAPDVRYMIVVRGETPEATLEAAEAVGTQLDGLVDDGAIGSYESPGRYLPSQARQAARRASLPDAGTLEHRLGPATAGLPLPAARLAPFIADVEAARSRPLLTREALAGTSFALAVDSMLIAQNGGWSALIPLRAPTTGPHAQSVDADRVRTVLKQTAPDALFIDMKGESERLYSGYLREAAVLSCAGLVAIIVLLGFALRHPMRVLQVLTPLAAAVLVVIAGLVTAGVSLTILHLVGLLLIVAVGSNYALFFDNDTVASTPAPRTLASLLFANLTTVTGFGVLAFSSVPVLQAFGCTVGPGAILALIFSAVLVRPTCPAPGNPAR